MANKAVREQEEFIARLRETLKPGDTVYTTVKHVSRSGMQRSINVFFIEKDTPRWLSYWVAKALGWGFDDKREAVKVGGCGMDMGFHLVYELSGLLFPDGFDCVGGKCPSADHSNRLKPPKGTCLDHVKRENGVCHDKNCKPWHHEKHQGAYALKQRWI